MRLDKFLVENGIGSRSQVKILLRKKEVFVNGAIETSPKIHIDPEKDKVAYKGETISYQSFLYYMLNKPSGVVSATEDQAHQTVLDLLDEEAKRRDVFPVGRLDKDTEGLLLLTNNGQLAHQLLSPKKHVDKVYQAEIDGIMDSTDQEAFSDGIRLKDHHCQPALLEILTTDPEKNRSLVRITIKEGKFHQVKRMVLARGKEVVRLKRLSMGPLLLDNQLALGSYRMLTESEIAALLNHEKETY